MDEDAPAFVRSDLVAREDVDEDLVRGVAGVRDVPCRSSSGDVPDIGQEGEKRGLRDRQRGLGHSV